MQLVIGQKKILGKQTVLGLIIEMLLLYYLPTYIAWLFLVFLVLFDGINERKDYNFTFKMSIGIILFGTLVGGVYLLLGKGETWPYFRDIIRISFLPLTILWTQKKSRSIGNNIYKAIFIFCGICVFVGMVQIIISGNYSASLYESVRLFRQKSFISEYILALGIFLFVFRKRLYGGNYTSSFLDVVIGIVCFAGVGLAFSRTALLLLFCLLIFQVRDIKRTIGIGIAAIAIVGLIIYFVPSLWDDFVIKALRSFTEVSQSNTWDSTNIVLNWRGYEVYCARTQFASANTFEKIFGIGYGRGIDANGYSYLVIDESTIPWLHNGYYTTLVKQGLIGIALIVFYWGYSLFDSRTISDHFSKRFYFGLIIGLMLSMIVATGIFWGGVPFVYFLVINELRNNNNTERVIE